MSFSEKLPVLFLDIHEDVLISVTSSNMHDLSLLLLLNTWHF